MESLEDRRLLTSIAILHADPSYHTEVRSQLVGTGAFTSVASIDVSVSTPTLAALLNYDSVLVYSNSSFANGTALGNSLADYVDSGKGVVEATFANASVPLFGRWQTGGYHGINPAGQTQGTSVSLGAVMQPGHAVMSGVTSFNGGSSSFRSAGGATAGSSLIASYNNGQPLVVEKPGFNGKIISLNFFPPSSNSRSDFWVASTDGTKLLKNSLNYVGEVTVNNVAPVLGAVSLSQSIVNENGSITLNGSFTDVNSLDTHTVEITWGDGTTSLATVNAANRTFTASHQYLDDGPNPGNGVSSHLYTIGVKVTDDDGAVAEDTSAAAVTVNNVAPQLQNVTITPSINENDFATLSGDIIDPGTLDTFKLVVDWGDGSAQQTYNLPAGSTAFSVTHQYLDDNPTGTASDIYTARIVSFTDDDGGSASFGSSQQLLVNGSFETGNFTGWTTSGLSSPYIRNPQVVPTGTTGYGFVATPTDGNFVVLAGFDGAGPGTMRIAQVVALPSGSISNLTFDWRAMWSHTQLPRTLSVNVETVGGSLLGSFLVYTTTPPGGADTGNQTSTVDLSAFAGQTVRVAIDQFIPQNFTGPAQMQIDNVSLLASQNLSVAVNNVAPTFAAGASEALSPSVAGVFTRMINFTDPGTIDVHTVSVDFGDGTGNQIVTLPAGDRSFNLNHTFATEGTFTVSVTVADDDLGSLTDTFDVTVELNTSPIAQAGGPYTVAEGSSIQLDASGTFDNEQPNATLAYEWDLDYDGITFNVHTTGIQPTVSFPDDFAARTIAVRVTDDGGLSDIGTTTLEVTNVVPTLTMSGTASVNEGSTYTLNLSASDPGADTITHWTINWGDGSPVQQVPGDASSITHVYVDGTRSHTIRAWATDEDGTWEVRPVGSNAIVSADPTFGTGGQVTADFFDSTSDRARDLAVVQPDGKIVLVGYKSGGVMDLVLVRYTADGLLDTSFGTGGVTTTDFGASEQPSAVLADESGRLLVAGNFGLVRYTPDGALDVTFGSNGRVNTFGTTIQAMAFDSQGRIVVAGSNRIGRYHNDGTFDLTFHGTGLRTNLTVPGLTTFLSLTRIAIDDQDRIVAGATASLLQPVTNSNTNDFVLVRFNENGSSDPSFGSEGKTVFDFGSPDNYSHDYFQALGIDSQGRIVAAGYAQRYNPATTPPAFLGQRDVLVRLSVDGAPDAAFNSAARAVTESLGSWTTYGLAVDPADNVLVTAHNGVSRFNADGTADSGFGLAGRTTTTNGVFDSRSLALVPHDGNYRILRVGYHSGPGTQGANLGAVRYQYDGTLDTSFAGGAGRISTDFQGSTSDWVRAVTLTQPDGRIVVAGYKSGGTTEVVLARYLADGATDGSFGNGGYLLTGHIGNPTAVALDSAGGVLVAFSNRIARYHADGTPDLGFGIAGHNYVNTSIQVTGLVADSLGGVVAAGYAGRAMPGLPSSDDFAVTRLSSTGVVDTTFGTNGLGWADFGTSSAARSHDIAQSIAVDADGRILLAGYSYKADSVTGQTLENYRHAIARFDPDGNLDMTFGTNGMVATSFGTGSYFAYSVAVDSAGRILAGGQSQLARYLSDGSLDPALGTGGTGRVQTIGSFRSIALDADGRIVLGGSNNIQRYTSVGTPDTTFAPSGRLVLTNMSVETLILDANDRILIGGSTTLGSNGADFLLARFITTGLAVTVFNVAPQNLSITGPTSATEGSTIELVGSATDPAGEHDPLTYTWTITRNGAAYAEAAGTTITFSAPDNGTYLATMRVDDGDGGVSTRSHMVSVSNVAPTATFNAPETGVEGTSFSVSLTDPTDVSPVDAAAGFTYAFNFGSGYGAFGTSNSASFAPPDSGTYTVQGKVRDKDGGEREYTRSVVVANVAPTATLSATASVTYGTAIFASMTDELDPSADDTTAGFRYAFNLDPSALTNATYANSSADPSDSFLLDAGTHTIFARIIDKDGGFTQYGTTVVVNRASLVVYADDQSKVYDGSPFTAFTTTFDGFIASDHAGLLGGELIFGGPAAGAIDAGTYQIDVGGLTSNNYDITFAPGILKINKADASIVVAGTTVTYDGGAHGATGSVTGVNGETLAGLDLGASFTNVPGGTANWTFTDVTGNYNDANGSVEITINKADATIVVAGTTVTYDGSAHGATGSVTGVNGEALAGLDLGASFTNVPGGTANWTFTDVTGNYNDANGSVEIVITKRSITVTADHQTKVYGDADPLLTYGITSGSLAATDNWFGELGRDPGENVGSYAIHQGSLALSDNYDLSFVDAELEITHATLTGDATTQDALNLAKQGLLKITVSNIIGFVNGENSDVFLSSATFWITIGGTKYEFVPTSVTKLSDSSISISYKLKNSALQEDLAEALESATSAATALDAGFSMESMNYRLSDDYLTRLFSTVKK